MFWVKKHGHDRANLSAYVDSQLSDRQTWLLERHLDSCDACRLELAGLRTVAAAVKNLPQAHTPRAFTLSPQQLARSAVAAALAFVLVIDASDVSIRGGGNGANEAASRLELASQTGAAIPPAATAATRESSGSGALNGEKAATPQATGTGEAIHAYITVPTETPPVGAAPAVAAEPTTEARAADDLYGTSPTDDLDARGNAVSQAAANNARNEDDGLSTGRVVEFILAGALAAVAMGGFGLALKRRS